MRLLKHGLGKRSPLFFNSNAGVSLNNPIDYTALDFNNTPVKERITENPVLTSSAPIDKTDLFTSSVNNPNTAYSFDNNVSLKPWTADDSANSSWAAFGAEPLSFGTDGNIKQELPETFNSSDVYKKTEEQNRKTEEDFRKLKLEEQKANAEKWGKLLAVFAQVFPVIAKMADDSGTA